MPWQMAPPMIIICGAFTLTGLALPVIDWVATGRVIIIYSINTTTTILLTPSPLLLLHYLHYL